jgi:regulatory Fis family protein
MQLMGEPDEERWARRYAEYCMEWRPSRRDRHYLGTYSMALGDPQRYFERSHVIWGHLAPGEYKVLDLARRRARVRWTPATGDTMPRWLCTWIKVGLERAPTVGGLPPATVSEWACSVTGAPACLIEIRWTNPPLGRSFWMPVVAGLAAGAASVPLLATLPLVAGVVAGALAGVAGLGGGLALRERSRRRHAERLLDLQSEEILYSNRELEKKLKRRMIEDALRECGSKTRAAERLGLTRQSLQQMLRRRQ